MTALSPALEAFRARAIAFMEPHVARFGQAARLGLSLDDDVALARRWQATKAAAGFAGLTFPTEYGGAGLSQIEQVLFVEEEAARGFPSAYFVISLSMPIPMMLRYATPEQKARFVPPALRGEEMWSQLFSEPSTGSDLAAVRTRAVRDGDDWILSGQKVWTTFAQYSDYGVIVARSDPDAPKHRGLTYFFVNLKAPGVTVRPIKQLHGAEEFNEVFFDDVRIPDAWRLGEVGAGFRLAVETLMIERYTAAADETGFGPPLEALVAVARAARLNGRPATEDGRVRAVIARAYATQQALSSIHEKSVMELAAGREPGPEGSIHKLVGSRGRRDVAICALDLLGAQGLRFDATAHPRPKTDFAMSWMDQPTLRIAGGTDEMLLNTVAERILGLPQDYRPDKAPR
ncbi:acyl-CoA dehydrogenase family protein [Caulobacter sp. LARHSG274]